MRLIRGTLIGLTFAMAVSGAPVLAQTIPTVGMQVTDPSGGAVGTVKAIQGDNILVQTDKHEALLPKSSFSVSNGKLLFAMTQAQLDAEIEKDLAAAQASIAPGSVVKGLNGAQLGKIDSVTDSAVVIALSSGQKVQVAKSGVRGNPDGTVTVGLTAEQLDAQVSKGATTPSAGK